MIRILKRDINSETIIHVTFLLLCLLPILVSFFLTTNGSSTAVRFSGIRYKIGLPCIFKASTGYNCPSCGMTRAFVYMSGFNVSDAIKMNRAGALLYIFCLMQIVYRSLRIFKPKIKTPEFLFWIQAIFLVFIGFIDLFDFIYQFI
jgi:hypothetical protein